MTTTLQFNQNTEVLLSIVLPCYNEEEVIQETYRRLCEMCDQLAPIRVEMLFIDDGSRDNTLTILRAFPPRDDRVKVIRLARNFGHQIAVTAGIDAAEGDAVVLIDADLQDPLEVIPQMIAKWREGFDVVYGTRSQRQGETTFKVVTARAFYRLLNSLSEVPIPLDTGDFRLMSRQVINALREMPERDRFIRGMVSWIGFRQTSLPYIRQERFAGVSKYPLRKMVFFALDGIISFSTKPLQVSIVIGMVFAALAVIGIIYAVALRVFTNSWVEGWTALMVAVLSIGAIQLICMGILGEYVGRIYNQTKGRPLYIVQEYLAGEGTAQGLRRSGLSAR